MCILIKGMEMPTSCFECKLLDYTDTYKCRARFESLAKEHGINISRPGWCPLVPVPPHVDLIDADAVGDFLRNKYWNSPWVRSHILDKIVRDIKGFQTIIPADHFGDANEMVTDKEGEG